MITLPVLHYICPKGGEIWDLQTRSLRATSLTWETVPIKKHICPKLWLYHNDNVHKVRKKTLYPFWELNGPYLKVESFHPRMLCAKFVLNRPSSSGENFKTLSMHFCYLCQVWLNLAQRFWWRCFLDFVNVFSLFLYYLPYEVSVTLHLNKLESLSLQNALR